MQTVKQLIGTSPLITNYAYSCNFLNLNSIYAQTLRWKRKPIWLPTAKTKVFRVPPRIRLPIEEEKEIQRLYNNYRTYYRSIRVYFKEVYEKNQMQLDSAVLKTKEEDDFNICFTINEEWNKNIAAEREIRLQQQSEANRLKILENIENKKKEEEEKILKIEKKIREAKLLAHTFITQDNIDQAIEEALANTVDYNKAFELNGNWYTDKSGLPWPEKNVTSELKNP